MIIFGMEIAEIMDFGYPQNLSPEILKLYITQEGVRSPFSSKVRASIHVCIQQIWILMVYGSIHSQVSFHL